MTSATDQVLAKLSDDGAGPEVIAAMRRRLEQLADPNAGMLPGEQLEPVPELPALEDLPDDERAREALGRIAVVKLNGGLGTSMGLRLPKSLVEVKPGRSFLDIVALQVLHLRARHGVRLPLVLMNSFSTREASLAALDRHPGIGADVPPDFLQSREPKLLADTREPVRWPADPELEWCPPGHGDLYVSLAGSGMLGALLDAGYRWAFVSNMDNLGASVEPRIAAWAEAEGVPFVLEGVRGTAADRKGGHLASRDGQLVLRESAQVPDGDESFGDVERWRYYNTNNLWVDLEALRRLLDERPSGPDLPLIVNRKTVDPADESSPAVLQLESAMGAAVGSIEGAQAVLVPRTRFAPVKTTDDLLVVRSDAWELRDDGRLAPTFEGKPPVVALDREHYKRVDQLETHFPAGPPSLRRCRRLDVHGEVDFGANVVVEGEVELRGPARVEDGERLSG
ncbi:MAG: UTP--glucose-1-phosphate uridylyltransferase [Actinomycetota bacterium]|nr:UTP--glucose-1-phosphate uridylyltransferase [Actinomycetota bacterium]